MVRLQHLRPLDALELIDSLKSMRAGSMGQFQALRAEGTIHLWGLGRPGRALTAYEEALTLARDGQATYYVNWLQVQLAVAHLQLDHLETARRLLPDRAVARYPHDRVDPLCAELALAPPTGRASSALPAAEEV